jgi:hypothetical protein
VKDKIKQPQVLEKKDKITIVYFCLLTKRREQRSNKTFSEHNKYAINNKNYYIMCLH